MSRYTDVTDILLGAVGTAIGAWIVARAQTSPRSQHERVTRRGSREKVRVLAAIAGYSLFLAVGFWFPFDVSTDRALARERLEGFFRVPFLALYMGGQFGALTQMLLRLLLFAPLGALWAYLAHLASTKGGRRVVMVLGVGYSATLAFAIELVQVLMPSRVADLTEVFLCTAGTLAGLLVSLSVLAPRGRRATRRV